MKRKDPTLREITAAMIAQHFGIPHDHVEAMTTEQILSLVHVDHDPVPVAIAVSLGWGPKQYNHPSNLTIRLIADHREKTAKHDIPKIYKSDRISDEHAAFQRRVLSKSGQDSVDGVADQITKPRAKLRSRGFAKAPEGHRWFQRGKG